MQKRMRMMGGGIKMSIVTILVGVLGILMIAFAVSMALDMEDIEHRVEKAWVAATAFVLSAAGVMLLQPLVGMI